MRRARATIVARSILIVITIATCGLLSSLSILDAAQRSIAPRFATRTVQGEKISLDALRARGPVLLDFWATWCKPCLAAIPEIEKLHAELGGRGLSIVGISVDGPRNFAKVRPFAKRVGITYPVVLDEDGSLQQRYQAIVMPTTVLIDTAGVIVKVMQAYRPGEIEMLRAEIEALLPASAPDSTANSSP